MRSMIHYQMSDQEHAAVSEAKRRGASFDRPEMLCRTGDGHAQGTRLPSAVTCPACLQKLNGETSVIRYVGTYVNDFNMRTLMAPAQGRNTYATKEEAQAWLDAVTQNNDASIVKQLWSVNPRFEVRPVPCYPGHFDPQTVWFDP